MKIFAMVLSLLCLVYSKSASSGEFERGFEAGKVAARSFERHLKEERSKVKVDRRPLNSLTTYMTTETMPSDWRGHPTLTL